MNIQFTALDSDLVDKFRGGTADANGQVPEREISDGSGLPCRHCLKDIEAGAPYLVLALRPFPVLQPYAELGPIFLHAEQCERHLPQPGLPDVLAVRETALIKGYGKNDRIKYGTGRIIPTAEIPSAAVDLFEDGEVAYIHVHSAQNNCYTCRIDRQ